MIGGGSGGVRAARVAAEAGARVALAEEYRYGGTCVIRGCMPKKLLVYASGFADAFDDAAGYGWTVGAPRFDWPALIAAKDAEIARLEAAYHDRLRRAGVQLFAARGDRRRPAPRCASRPARNTPPSHLLVATGGRPFVPDIPGAELGITSNEIFDLETQPKRMLDRRRRLCRLRVRRHHERPRHPRDPAATAASQILRGFDDDLRDHVADAMRARGIVLEIQRDVTAIEQAGDGAAGHRRQRRDPPGRPGALRHRPRPEHRRPRPRGARRRLARERRGRGRRLVADRGALDLRGGRRHRPRRADPGRDPRGPGLRRDGLRRPPARSDHRLIPTAIFTQPEAAALGLTEAEARARGRSRSTATGFRPLLNTLSGRAGADADEARGRSRQPPGARRAPRRPRRRGDDPARRGRACAWAPPRTTSTARWRCTRHRPRNW